MNLVLKIVLVFISLKILYNGFDMILNPDNEFYLREICINCKSKLYGVFLGIVLILFFIGILFRVFRKT